MTTEAQAGRQAQTTREAEARRQTLAPIILKKCSCGRTPHERNRRTRQHPARRQSRTTREAQAGRQAQTTREAEMFVCVFVCLFVCLVVY